MVRSIGVGRQEAAAMRSDYFELRKSIEYALEDEVRERDRRLQGIADRVGEPAVAGQFLRKLGDARRMNEQGHVEFFRLGPHRMKFRIGKCLAVDSAADRGSLEPLF